MMTQSKKIILIVIFGVLANIGLFMNAGYFSHDEIGWGIKAISSSSIHDIKYYNIFNYNEFHYRPLNFNLWLLSSYYLFDTPQLFHLALLCCGMVNAALFYFIIRHFTNEKVAFLSSLVSTVMPSVVFVNGWIGTIADVFWLMCCCISFLLFLHSTSTYARNLNKNISISAACLFFIFALMFKETAVVYPSILFLYIAQQFIYNKKNLLEKKKISISFFLICSFIVIGYLTLRFEFLFPKHGGYGTSLGNIPTRALEYFIFPFLLDNTEIHGLFNQYEIWQLSIAIFLHFILIILVCRRSLVSYIFYFLFYYVGSIPILILDMSLPHYIYTSGFTLAVSIAILYYRSSYYRFISVIFFALLFIHSVSLQKNFVATGNYQNNFVNTLYSVISSNKDDDCQYLITPELGSTSWVAVRAISFRNNIDDLTLPKDVVFDKSQLNPAQHKQVCKLSLDIFGRVKLLGIEDVNAK
ncbi:hypothetical protein [Enterobacter roggenkampii]|uniref:hypothetical protein n=1 Tax=Enterobacter roggenkampii TaxID=1812935 RepID=UPI00207573B2|nr:hypothetical protein [Enterobacter roggenkampii]MCM7826643.1 hypothetical protein [Enterobacter roggenkampii]